VSGLRVQGLGMQGLGMQGLRMQICRDNLPDFAYSRKNLYTYNPEESDDCPDASLGVIAVSFF
jgi:hypothetical protein